MFRLGRLLFGIAVASAAAATVYNYLDQSNKKADEDLDDDFPQEDGAEPESGESAGEDYTEKFRNAATRTYTTIKESSADAMAKVKEAIGPKGEEVLDVAVETAGKVRNAVVDSAARVKDILQEEGSEIDEEVVEEAVATAMAQEMADANDPVCVDWNSGASEEIHEDDTNKEAVYEGEENGEAIHEDDHDKEAIYEEEFPEEADDAAEEAVLEEAIAQEEAAKAAVDEDPDEEPADKPE